MPHQLVGMIQISSLLVWELRLVPWGDERIKVPILARSIYAHRLKVKYILEMY